MQKCNVLQWGQSGGGNASVSVAVLLSHHKKIAHYTVDEDEHGK
jgi:hypothetical protein